MLERAGALFLIGVAWMGCAGLGCAPRNEATPHIGVAPGLRERLVLMDRFRRTSDGRPRIPHVTVEEIDDAESDAADDAATASTPDEPPTSRASPARSATAR